MCILAIDPGRVKFGYAVLATDKQVLHQGIAEADDLLRVVAEIVAGYRVRTVVIGDRTGGTQFATAIRRSFPADALEVALVGEDGSSREGRHRFLLANRRGWRRFLPLGLQSPWRPFDDYVAVILGERYLDQR